MSGALSGYQGRLLIVGCGNMGGAMLRGWLAAGLPPAHVTIVDPMASGLPDGVTRLDALDRDCGPFDLVLLSVKPQLLAAVAPQIQQAFGPQTLLLSILAGSDRSALARHFPTAGMIVRLMPNMAVSIGQSPLALFCPDADARGRIDPLMAPLGSAFWLEREEQLHGVTALTGSGPAFVFRFIDALASGAEALGLPGDQAQELALAMVRGAAELAVQSEHDPAELARRVASPGGVTQRGLDVLDADDALARLVADTLRAARDRSEEMAREFG